MAYAGVMSILATPIWRTCSFSEASTEAETKPSALKQPSRKSPRNTSIVLVRWQQSFVTGLLSEFPLLLWRRGPGRGGRLYGNLLITILELHHPATSHGFLFGFADFQGRDAIAGSHYGGWPAAQ